MTGAVPREALLRRYRHQARLRAALEAAARRQRALAMHRLIGEALRSLARAMHL